MSDMKQNAVLSVAITPKTPADEEKLRRGLATLTAEDPALRITTDALTGVVTIAGMGELHLEIVLDRLNREFNVEAGVGRPQVAYREALTCPADGQMLYALLTGARGQYAHVKIHLHPSDAGSGYVFDNNSRGRAIPEKFIMAIDEGIREALTQGVVAGYPIEDVRVELYDIWPPSFACTAGSYHDRDSSELAFKIAGSLALQDAAKKARPMLLEPVMRVTITVPTERGADVVGDLSNRRGRIRSQEDRGSTQVIIALVPLAELFGYSGDLRERTRGRGAMEMELDHYEPCRWPPDGDAGSHESFVMAPRTPLPTARSSGVALPEPDGDDTAS
jgi:elongation factor G